MRCTTFTFALLLSGVIGLTVPPTHEIHEKGGVVHARWTKGAQVSSRSVLPMRIGLAQNDVHAEAHLMDVSDPRSPNFGSHWTAEEVAEAFRPSDEAIAAVYSWLTSSGVPRDRIAHSTNKGWIAFDATADEAERLLHTTFYEFRDSITGATTPVCDHYSLPRDIRKHVDFIKPGVAPPVLKSRGIAHPNKRAPKGFKPTYLGLTARPGPAPDVAGLPANLQDCDQTITPECLAALYQIPPTDNASTPVANNTLGIYSNSQHWDQLDMDLFFSNLTNNIPNGTHPITPSINGGVARPTTNISEATGEVLMDLQVAYPVIYPQQITLYQPDDDHYNEDYNVEHFNNFLDAFDGSYCTFSAYGETGNNPEFDPVYPDPAPGGYKGELQCGILDPPNVISISYGGFEVSAPAAYQKRRCLEYLKLGLQGVSILFASGDAGVGDYQAPYSHDPKFNQTTGCLGPTGEIFNPLEAASCPWVTAVGATQVDRGKTVKDPETVMDVPAGFLVEGFPSPVNTSSGGGFSNLYPVPDYQKAAVDAYFKAHNPAYPSYSVLANNTDDIPKITGGVYNRIGRGYPDVAANGLWTGVNVQGGFYRSGGTSASTPLFSAVINRINEERLKGGKSSVGFLNPTLYAHPEVLNDIVSGKNPGCTTDGFSAVEGWDPVTGLGTPNFPKMLDLWLKL